VIREIWPLLYIAVEILSSEEVEDVGLVDSLVLVEVVVDVSFRLPILNLHSARMTRACGF